MNMYRENYIQECNERADAIHSEAWVHGQYILRAIQCALIGKKAKYPDKPFGSNSEAIQQDPEIQALKFEEWANVFNKSFLNKNPLDSALE